MIYRNMEALKLTASWKVVKVGDTISDIQEGTNAGVWSVGVSIGSSLMGLSSSEYNSLSDNEKETIITKTEEAFIQNGADFTIRTMAELPGLIEKINGLLLEGKRTGSK
jgi:phosphonoacetaldehyde hydrolase